MNIQKRVGCIGYFDNKLLFVRNTKGEVVLVKGHIEEGEAEIDGALREFKEETGFLDIVLPITKIDDFSYIRDSEKFVMPVYLIKLNSLDSETKTSEDGKLLENVWLDKENIESVVTHKNVLPLVEKLHKLLDPKYFV
jgi:8-oxo-dGTP pyrophosphatase MutT (NUDIX family)